MVDSNNRTQTVNLGCGTMILIALIVLIFGNRGRDDVRRELQSLRTEVTELRQAVDAQSALLKTLAPASPTRPTTSPTPPASAADGGVEAER